VQIEQTSKAAYGYALLQPDLPHAASKPPPELDAKSGVPHALRSAAIACFTHMEANAQGVARGLGDECLRQARVGLRRLRVVLTLAQAWHDDSALRKLLRDTSEMRAAFGRLREWDVFLTQTLAEDAADLRVLRRHVEERRNAARADLENWLASGDYQRFLLRLGVWLHGDYWKSGSKGKKNGLPRFAARELAHRAKRLKRWGRDFAGADAVQLHGLRIACKKLRYATDMFSPLFDAAVCKRYLSALSSLQEELGVLNDLAVAAHLLEELELVGARRQTVARVQARLESEWQQRHIAAGKTWKRFCARWNGADSMLRKRR
jgi:CHAD domain-containing protein